MTLRWMSGALLLLLAAAGCGNDLASTRGVDSDETPSTVSGSTTSVETTTSSPLTSAPVTTTQASSTTTTMAPSVPPIPPGEIRVEPAGPYRGGDRITLLAADAPLIDLWNSSPRLCASVDGASEVCSADALRPTPLRTAPSGTQGATVDVTRMHFGERGYSDCGAPEVACRLIWRNEDGHLLTSPILEFVGDAPPLDLPFTAEVGDEPGQIRLHTNGFDFATDLGSIDQSALAEIAATIDEFGEYDPTRLEIEWSVTQLCGFGPATQTIGSEELVDAPSWWWRHAVDEEAEALGFFGPVCDWNAVDGSLGEIDEGGMLELRVRRNIYGYGGWVDCAAAVCFLQVGWSWLHPEPGGGMIGGEGGAHRVPVDIPDSWPAQFPGISIIEPGPYTGGQTVTVEVTGIESEEIAIGWCQGGDRYCGWKFASVQDGVASVEWTIQGTADSCGSNRCYFAIDSASEGLAPPAIVLAPIVDG